MTEQAVPDQVRAQLDSARRRAWLMRVHAAAMREWYEERGLTMPPPYFPETA